MNYPYNYLQVLNDMYNAIDMLNFTQGRDGELLQLLSDAVITNREKLLDVKKKIDSNSFAKENYDEILDIAFGLFCDSFFEKLNEYAQEYILQRQDIVSMNDAESNLRNFCIKQEIETPDVLYDTADDFVETADLKKQYLGYELIDDGVTTAETDNRYNEIAEKIIKFREKINAIGKGTVLLMSDQEAFDRYFVGLSGIAKDNKLRRKTVAILDDQTETDNDLLFTIDGIIQIVKGKMKEPVSYDHVKVLAEEIGLMIYQQYVNANVDIKDIIEMIKTLRENPAMEVHESGPNNPIDFVWSIFKR